MSALSLPSSNVLSAGRLTRLLIWAFALCVVALAWGLPLQRIRADRADAVASAIDQNRIRAIMLEQYVSRTLEAADIATLHIAERYRSRDSGLALGTRLRPASIAGPIAGNRSFLGLSIVDPNGDVVASTLGPGAAGQNVRGHEAFQIHAEGRSNGRLYVSRPAYSRLLRRQILWLTRRLDRPDGTFGGVVAVNIAPEQLIGFNEAVPVRPTDVVSVIGLDGVTRARRTGNVFSTGEDVSGRLVMRQQLANPNGTYVGPSALDGIVRYFSHRRLPDFPLFATYGVLERDVLRPVERRERLFFAVSTLVTFVTLGFAFVLASLLARRDRWAEDVAQANARLREAQRIGQIGDWDFDMRTGQSRWSPQLQQMYERDPDGPAPTLEEFKRYLDPESAQVVDDAIARAIETGQAQDYEIVAHLPSGAESHRLVSAIPPLDADGKVVSLHGVDQDVSARTRLDRLEAEVSHLSRLAAMNAMAATLAHELNQPLAAASNYLVGSRKLLASANAEPSQALEGLEAAEEQVQFAGDIIRRVRGMVSNEPRQLGACPVARILDDALALASAGSDFEGIELVKRIDPDARWVEADRVQVQQVLLNLVRNAREAVDGAKRPCIAITSRRDGDAMVRISVEDNGPGLADTSGRLFTAFVSDKPSGLGLGLSISRTIVEAHGGRIWAENRAEGGARFSFTLPAAEAPSD